MNISLYYIEGISRIDTPLFANIDKQKQFFESKIVISLDNFAYYPPHYLNEIKLEVPTDISMRDNVNYVSLCYDDKLYYYFIDNIKYVNEGVLIVSLTMDVIQTYMFNIKVASGYIKRKFIDRWKKVNSVKYPYLINRNYIRENVSESNYFVLKEHIAYNNYGTMHPDKDILADEKKINGMLVFQCSDKIFDDDNDPTLEKEAFDTSSSTNYCWEPLNYRIYVVPLIFSKDNILIIDKDNNQARIQYAHLLERVLSQPTLVNAYFIPNVTFGLVTVENSVGNYKATGDNIVVTDGSGTSKTGLISVRDTVFNSPATITYSFDFQPNKELNVIFDKKYMPMILDENYIRVEFGEGLQMTSSPLFYSEITDIRLIYQPTLIYGNRTYNIQLNMFSIRDYEHITDDSYTQWGNPNTYSTALDCTDMIRLPVFSDPYKQWLVYNKASIPMAFVSTMTNMFVGAAINSNNTINTVTTTKHTGTSYGDEGKVVAPTRFSTTKTSTTSDAPHYVSNNSAQLGSVATSLYNAAFSPKGFKSAGTLLAGLSDNSIQPTFNKHVISDIDYVASYYHKNGYLVNEFITNVDNIFNYVLSRYYFNVIRGEQFEIHLANVIEDEKTCDIIKQRFENGLRLWNVNNESVVMGDFTYDNVELSMIERS